MFFVELIGTYYSRENLLFVPDDLLSTIKTKEDLQKIFEDLDAKKVFGNFSVGNDFGEQNWADYVYSQSGTRLSEDMSKRVENAMEEVEDDVLKTYIKEKYILTQPEEEQNNFMHWGYGDGAQFHNGSTIATQEYMRKFGNLDPKSEDYKKQMTIDYIIDRVNKQMDADGIKRGPMNLDKIKYIELDEDGNIYVRAPGNTDKFGNTGNTCRIMIDKNGNANIYGVQTSKELRNGVVDRSFDFNLKLDDWQMPKAVQSFTNAKEFYDENGKLTRKEEKIGEISDPSDKRVTYYGENGNPIKMVETIGSKTWEYSYRENGTLESKKIHNDDEYGYEDTVILYNEAGKTIKVDSHVIDGNGSYDKYQIFDESGEKELLNVKYSGEYIYDSWVARIEQKLSDDKVLEEIGQKNPEDIKRIRYIIDKVPDDEKKYYSDKELLEHKAIELVFNGDQIVQKTCGNPEKDNSITVSYDENGKETGRRLHLISEVKEAVSDLTEKNIDDISSEYEKEGKDPSNPNQDQEEL